MEVVDENGLAGSVGVEAEEGVVVVVVACWKGFAGSVVGTACSALVLNGEETVEVAEGRVGREVVKGVEVEMGGMGGPVVVADADGKLGGVASESALSAGTVTVVALAANGFDPMEGRVKEGKRLDAEEVLVLVETSAGMVEVRLEGLFTTSLMEV